MKFKRLLTIVLLLPMMSFAQSDLDKVLKGGELLLGGISIFKVAKSDGKKDSKLIESVCVKNKRTDRITFRIVGKNEEGDEVKKELVVPKDGKECVFELPKGIYTYEIVLANKEILKKGEYKFEEEVIITVRDE
ncbi:MAG TPA: hypothetical protein PK218_00530 [Flavobacterium sp.]|uniref:hypothetical protein n=2 Tax=Flavobacterium sp. TaxID=239 RepID=UPI002C329A87|nr:hypothetical protein [Flavobacterium sp.]